MSPNTLRVHTDSLAEIVEVEIEVRVAIYRPLGEVSLSLNRTVTCMVLKADDRRTSCPCHDEFRGLRSDYVRQVEPINSYEANSFDQHQNTYKNVSFSTQRQACHEFEHSTTKDRRVGQRYTLNLLRAETSSRGVVWLFGEGVPAQVLSTSLDHGQNYVVLRQKPS
ncbi:uncharacterized protein TNCV_2714751 [Trichonephila clavipes]|nr:uncharacterized protein TNCV_2714751 [Trichonephila clavipes]